MVSNPEIGSQSSFNPNTICRMMATQNAGADTPMMDRIITTVSMPLPRLTAAKMPVGIPRTAAKTNAMQASLTVTPKLRIRAEKTTSFVK